MDVNAWWMAGCGGQTKRIFENAADLRFIPPRVSSVQFFSSFNIPSANYFLLPRSHVFHSLRHSSSSLSHVFFMVSFLCKVFSRFSPFL